MNNSAVPPIFVINLESAIDRRESITQQMNKYNLNFEFIKAVDKNHLTETQRKYYSEEESILDFGRGLTDGEIACALSHYSIFEKILKENIKTAIVFEDDIIINEDTVAIIKRQYAFPKDMELLYFLHGKVKSLPWKRKTIYKDYKIVKYLAPTKNSKRSIIYAAAYQITRDGAYKQLREAYPVKLPADIHMGYIQRNKVKAYGIEPNCAGLGDFETGIPDRPDV